MIIAKEPIKNFIEAQQSVEILAEKLDVAHSTLYGVAKGNNVSSEIVAKLLKETGFDFEKGFEVKE